MEQTEESLLYQVVINDEEQYSIWPVDRPDAPGWTGAGVRGTREECLAWIGTNWTDMRPASLRRAMTADGGAVSTAPDEQRPG